MNWAKNRYKVVDGISSFVDDCAVEKINHSPNNFSKTSDEKQSIIVIKLMMILYMLGLPKFSYSQKLVEDLVEPQMLDSSKIFPK